MARDRDYATISARQERSQEVNAVIVRWTLRRTAEEVTELLQDEGIPASPVLKAHELLENPQLRDRGFFQELEHPDTGLYPYAGVPWRLTKTPGRLGGPAPCLGQHNKQVLQELLGMPSCDFQRLVDSGVTGNTPILEG